MELKEIWKIFRANWRLYVEIVCAFILIGVVFFAAQPKIYKTSLMLNVSRKATQETSEYRYDNFYRLQADERFADTIVRWIGDPTVKHEIAQRAKLSDGQIDVVAQRLSSQMISVTITTTKPQDGKIISRALAKEINEQTDKLNKEQQEETWFTVLASDSLTSLMKISFSKILLASIIFGIFLGFWIVLFKHYLKK